MKISIIIATYNAESFLSKCLESIIPQLNKNIELIIIDGNSSDNTLEIINTYSSNINFWISEPDKGIYDAWNKGISHSTGEWIMFIGADDILLPNSLNKLTKLLQDIDLSTYDYISCKNQYSDLSDKVIKTFGKPAKWEVMRIKMCAAHVASLHNRSNLFNKVGVYDTNYKICADYELLLRKRNKLKYYYFDNVIANMRVGGMSFSTKAIRETYKIRKQHSTINLIFNIIMYFIDYFLFKFFVFRNKLKGNKI